MKQAVILAGGRGERLRPLTQDRPKCMIELLGNPLMAYQLHWLHSYGINQVTVSCGYMHEMVRNYFGDGSKWQMSIQYIVEDEPLGRGGALKRAMKELQTISEPILAINGDNISNLSIDDLMQFHLHQLGMATIVTVPLRSPYGIVETSEDGTVIGFREKPELPYGVNAGIYVLNPEIVQFLPDKGDHEETTFPELASQGQLKAYQTRSFWRTVDTVKDVAELRSDMEKMLLGAFFQAATV